MLLIMDFIGCESLADTNPIRTSNRRRVWSSWRLLAFGLLCCAATSAQQGGGAAPAKTSPNPLSSLLKKEEPKAPVIGGDLPEALPEKTTAIALPDVAARSMELSQK